MFESLIDGWLENRNDGNWEGPVAKVAEGLEHVICYI